MKKVSSRGPATGIVNPGDRITSITIDFRHIVQEDAISILSYASPYNVQLELIDGKGIVPQLSQSPKQSHSPLSHPLYRSSSQDNFDTIEKNSRKKLFPNDDTNYPTLKMETSSPVQKKNQMPSVHKENEKEKKNSFKQQIKGLMEEKLQHRSASPEKVRVDVEKSPQQENVKKPTGGGLKFGIRVLPPNVNEKIFGKSPTKIQADNENNQNIEKTEEIKIETPPTAKRRSKDKIQETTTIVENIDFQRQSSINSSGIKRDENGIPQEVPSYMMDAAMAAKESRKSINAALDLKKSKGKAPKPPPTHMDIDLDASTTTIDTNLSIDIPDSGAPAVAKNRSDLNVVDTLNFSDNFADQVLERMNNFDDVIEGRGPSNSSTPKNIRKVIQHPDESDEDDLSSNDQNKIELDSKHITIHQTSEEESGDDCRKTASLGDLSKFDGKLKQMADSRTNNGTLERAQSLEISDTTLSIAGSGSNKKRKSTTSDSDLTFDSKEPRLMTIDLDGGGGDTMQRGRLRSAYDFGTMEDVIHDNDDINEKKKEENQDKNVDMMEEVMAAADKFNKELRDEIESVFERKEDEMLSHKPNETVQENGYENMKEVEEPLFIRKFKKRPDHICDHLGENGTHETLANGNGHVHDSDHQSMSPVAFTAVETIEEQHPNVTDHVKIINFGTNISDDVKVSRYPFGSLERPKSDVLKKLIEIQKQDKSAPITNQIMTTTTTTTIMPSENIYLETQPISLTMIGNSDVHENGNGNYHNGDDSQLSPVYSSDNQGVNSISISSMELNIGPSKDKRDLIIPGKLGKENIVTISTDSTSQPSSIIMIEDEKLDFTLQTPDGSEDGFTGNEEDENLQKNGHENMDHKTFVTEITVKSQPNEQSVRENREMNENYDGVKVISSIPTQIHSHHHHKQLQQQQTTADFMAQEKEHADDNYMPRNSEIRFTTSTYESPSKVEKRFSQINELRSNFENKNHGGGQIISEIPVLVRNNSSASIVTQKSSIPTLKSPSKIPVFHSKSNTGEQPTTQTTHISTTTLVNSGIPLKSTSPNGGNNVNRVSVSVTSIKNLSRHPSGKL